MHQHIKPNDRRILRRQGQSKAKRRTKKSKSLIPTPVLPIFKRNHLEKQPERDLKKRKKEN